MWGLIGLVIIFGAYGIINLALSRRSASIRFRRGLYRREVEWVKKKVALWGDLSRWTSSRELLSTWLIPQPRTNTSARVLQLAG